MWTYTILEKIFDKVNGGVLKVVVSFTNGTNSFDKTFQVSSVDSLKLQISGELNRLVEQDKVLVTPGVLPDLTPTAPAPLTVQAQAAQDWLKSYDKWVQVKNNLIDTGILTGNETACVNLLDKVKTGFKVTYLDLL